MDEVVVVELNVVMQLFLLFLSNLDVFHNWHANSNLLIAGELVVVELFKFYFEVVMHFLNVLFYEDL